MRINEKQFLNISNEMAILRLRKKLTVHRKLRKKWINECGCECYFSHGTSNSRGVMIFFSNKLEVTVKEKITDTNGRIIILKCEIQQSLRKLMKLNPFVF